MKICTCNNCGNIYQDTNPGNESLEYPDYALNSLELIKEPETGDFMNACPVCETDANLVDNINETALNVEQALNYKHFFSVDDLFSTPQFRPADLKCILEKYSQDENDYESCKNMLTECEAIGYTFEYYLDAVPFNLRKI